MTWQPEVDEIERRGKLAEEMGGWVVSTEQTQKHRGSISIP